MIGQLVEKHLASIIMGLIAAASAYLVGTTKTDARLTAIEAAEKDGLATDKGQSEQIACLIRHIDQLRSGTKGESPCPLVTP